MDAHPSRKCILDHIRAALAEKSGQESGLNASVDRETGLNAAGVFAPIDDSLARFGAECKANRTELHAVTAENEAERLREMLVLEASTPESGDDSVVKEACIFVQDAPELRRLIEGISRSVRWSSSGRPQASDLAVVTLAEALVARTGSVLITTLQGGRAASVLPPVHIVYAQIAQLVNELGEALDRVQATGRVGDVSMLSLITGPSRTSDIEKTLVLGAHGPRRLVILLRV